MISNSINSPNKTHLLAKNFNAKCSHLNSSNCSSISFKGVRPSFFEEGVDFGGALITHCLQNGSRFSEGSLKIFLADYDPGLVVKTAKEALSMMPHGSTNKRAIRQKMDQGDPFAFIMKAADDSDALMCFHLPDTQSLDDVIKFIGLTPHEYTHVLQWREPGTRMFNQSLGKSGELANDVWQAVEASTTRATQKKQSVIRELSETALLEGTQFPNARAFETFLKNLSDNTIKTFGGKSAMHSDKRMKVYEYLERVSRMEAEAYRVGQEVLRRYTGDGRLQPNHLLPIMYDFMGNFFENRRMQLATARSIVS